MDAVPTVPDYDLLRRIGAGSYGEVWLARSKATGVLRAAKIVWRNKFEDERPFEREFEGIQKFERISREHPGQLALFHIGRNEAEGNFYYVMELADDLGEQGKGVLKSWSNADGQEAQLRSAPTLQNPDGYVPHTLRADLSRGRLPADRVLEIALALAEALGHLHRHGLVHRDVKPSNVIFVNGRPKLADIGLVTDASDQHSIVGTEGYLPQDGPGTPQADIFALGKVLYEAATGMDRRKFPDLPASLKSWPEAASVLEMNQVVLRACASDVRARYQSSDEMRQDLVQLKQSKSLVRARQLERRWRNVRRGASWLAAAAALLGLLTLANRGLHPAAVPYVEKPSTNSAANAYYAEGKTHFDQFTSNALAQAVACFQRAIDKDPRFAAPYGYLAAAYSWWAIDGWNVGWHDLPKAKTNAELALALDDSLAEPHLALGTYRVLKEWDWSAAEVEYKKAMRLNPSPFCRLNYAEFLRKKGLMKEALAQISEARAQDRNSRIINTRFACFLRDAHRFEMALAEIDRIGAMGLSERMAFVKANALCALGRYREAVDSELQMHSSPPAFVQRLKSAVEFGNANAYWKVKLEVATNIYEQACCLAQSGDGDGAMRALDEAATKTNVFLTFYVMTDWRLDRLRSRPAFEDLLKRMRLQ